MLSPKFPGFNYLCINGLTNNLFGQTILQEKNKMAIETAPQTVISGPQDELARVKKLWDTLENEHKYPDEIAHIYPPNPNFPAVRMSRSSFGTLHCFCIDQQLGANFKAMWVESIDGINHIKSRTMTAFERRTFIARCQSELCLDNRKLDSRAIDILRKAREVSDKLQFEEERRQLEEYINEPVDTP